MHANKKSNLIAIFAIAALSSGTLAFAATDTNPSPQKLTPQEKTVNKDFSKVSADGSGASGLFSSLIYEVGFGIPGWADV